MLAGLMMATASAGSAHAGESPSSAWGSVWNFGIEERQLRTNEAIASEIARKQGYGPGGSSYETYIDEQVTNVTNNGDQLSSGGTNVLNMTTVDNRLNIGAGSSGNVVTASTGTTQNSGQASQDATAVTTATSGDGTATVETTTSSGG